MVSYSDIETEFNTNWNTGVIQKPSIYDINLRYSTIYSHVLFLKVYDNMPMKPISQSNNAGLVKRKQFFKTYGVYSSFADAIQALREVKRIITEKKGWYINGNGSIQETRKRFIFILPSYELTYLQKSEW